MPSSKAIQGPLDTELDETAELELDSSALELEDSSDELLSSELELIELDDSSEELWWSIYGYIA